MRRSPRLSWMPGWAHAIFHLRDLSSAVVVVVVVVRPVTLAPLLLRLWRVGRWWWWGGGCMRKWIVAAATQGDVSGSLHAPLLPLESGSPSGSVAGIEELATGASCPPAAVRALETELLTLGAAHVRELSKEDWHELASFQALRKFEQRRLLQKLCPA